MDQAIIALMPLAERLGNSYARKYKAYQPEAVAEAYCLLVDYFHSKAYHLYGVKDGYIRTRIYAGLIDYFQGRSGKRRRTETILGIDKDIIYQNTDQEMIEWLGELLTDDKLAIEVLKNLKLGMTYDEVEMLSFKLIKASKNVAKLVAKRIKNLYELKQSGIATTSEIYANISSVSGCDEDDEDTGYEEVRKTESRSISDTQHLDGIESRMGQPPCNKDVQGV